MRLPFVILIVSFYSLLGQDQWKDIYKESAWADRDKWQKADELIKQLKLQPGSKVADIGCNEGYMTFKLSSVVSNTGKVYAVDVKQEKLDKLKEHATKRSVTNIIAV